MTEQEKQWIFREYIRHELFGHMPKNMSREQLYAALAATRELDKLKDWALHDDRG